MAALTHDSALGLPGLAVAVGATTTAADGAFAWSTTALRTLVALGGFWRDAVLAGYPAAMGCVDAATALVTGDGGPANTIGNTFPIPVIPDWNGLSVRLPWCMVFTAGTSGLVTVQIRKTPAGHGSDVDLLTTKLTIDANEWHTSTAATPAVVNTSNAVLATGDTLWADIDVISTGAKGLAFGFFVS